MTRSQMDEVWYYGCAPSRNRTPELKPCPEMIEKATRAICTLNDGGYCECVGESLGCKVGRGDPPEISRCKMTDAALPLTAEYRMAKAVAASLSAYDPDKRLREALEAADALAAQVNRDGAEMNGFIMLELKRYMNKRAALSHNGG